MLASRVTIRRHPPDILQLEASPRSPSWVHVSRRIRLVALRGGADEGLRCQEERHRHNLFGRLEPLALDVEDRVHVRSYRSRE